MNLNDRDRIEDSDFVDEARQFRLLLNGVTDYAIYMLDPQGFITTWNPGGERIKGYSREEIVGSHFSRFYTNEDIAGGVPERGLDTAREMGRFSAEGWRIRKDGTRFFASVVIDPIWSDGKLIGYAKVTRDITERQNSQRQLEEAQASLLQAQKLEAVGKLTLGLAHDFNNLLAVVINALDLIAIRVTDDPRVTRNVEAALRAAERGSLLTRQLLTFGRGQNLVPKPMDVNQSIQDLQELIRRSCTENIELNLALSPDLPEVEVDKPQFEAALLNAVVNSRDAMTEGGKISITISTTRGRPCGLKCTRQGNDLRVRHRQWTRHSFGHPRTGLRTLLYHQRDRKRKRAWPEPDIRVRKTVRWTCIAQKHAGTRDLCAYLPPYQERTS